MSMLSELRLELVSERLLSLCFCGQIFFIVLSGDLLPPDVSVRSLSRFGFGFTFDPQDRLRARRYHVTMMLAYEFRFFRRWREAINVNLSSLDQLYHHQAPSACPR